MPQLNSEKLIGSKPLQEALLEALSTLSCSTYSSELSLYLRARWGESTTPSCIERLVHRDFRLFERTVDLPSDISLCPALTAERGEPILRLITRADWPLSHRLISATTGRLRHLCITARFCELTMDKEQSFADYNLLLKHTAILARGLPHITVKYEQYEPETWCALAYKLIKALSREDEQARVSAAAQLLASPNFNQFYGMPEGAAREV
jgi:hypothetical protein